MGFVLTLSSCKKDDDNPTPPTVKTDPFVGTWVSDGANICPGLRVAPTKIKKIVVTFNENKSYTVLQTDSSNVQATLTGTYSVTESSYTDTLSTSFTKGGKIYNITCNQSSPSALTSVGIYCISGTNMTYEVIVNNLAGVVPPTAAGGFGSTVIYGNNSSAYVQKYVKQ
jgi:hypothetical protein